jgi:acetoin utilization deacetylase AcuC-like enzyme
MTQGLMKLADDCANGRLVSILEGGYSLDVLYKCVVVHVLSMINGYEI